MESWLLGWLIGSIAVLLIQYFVAREFQRIAEMKGHHEKRYFWITFFLWIVGTLGKVKIIEPNSVNERFDSFVKEITDNY